MCLKHICQPVWCHLNNVLANETFAQANIQYFVEHSAGIRHIQAYLGQEVIDPCETLIEIEIPTFVCQVMK